MFSQVVSLSLFFISLTECVRGATCLPDELHAAVGGAGNEAVAQIPSRQLSCIDAAQPGGTGNRG